MSTTKNLLALAVLGAAGINAQPMRWAAGPSIPADATRGGHENGAPLYVCRAAHAGGVHPGKVVAGNCNISYGGAEFEKAQFDVLAGPGRWAAPSAGPIAAFPAGNENRGPLTLCSAAHNGGVHPGKVVVGKCHFGWGGQEILANNFEVFEAAVRSANSDIAVKVVFRNGTPQPIDIYWVDYVGNQVSYGQLAPGRQIQQDTFATHPWVFRQGSRVVASYRATSAPIQHFGPGAAPSVASLQAGPIWSTDDARVKCPSVCTRSSANWNEAWRTTEVGRMSTCDCVGFF